MLGPYMHKKAKKLGKVINEEGGDKQKKVRLIIDNAKQTTFSL